MMINNGNFNVKKDNEDISCYFTTKHSWKGKYKRIFSVGSRGITTYNPSSTENTNQWSYDDFINISPNLNSKCSTEFFITVKKGKNSDKMKFSCEHRVDLLTDALKFRSLFAEKSQNSKRFNAYKYHWSEKRLPILLEVNQASLDQLSSNGKTILASYYYKDMEGVTFLSDFPGGFAIIYDGWSRLHLFALSERDELVRAIQEAATSHVGFSVKLRKEAITLEQFQNHRLGKFSTDEALTSCSEFTVIKHSNRHTNRPLDPTRRIFCITETCLVERDPSSYIVCTVKPLLDIFAIIRHDDDPQKFSIEYVRGSVRTYASTDRDSLIASLLDGIRASGNRDVCVRMTPTKRGLRLGPFTVPVDEEVESQHLKFIQTLPNGMTFAAAVDRFNANISYSGLLHAVTADGLFAENKEKLIQGALTALLEKEGDQNVIPNNELEAQFHALRRLIASKAGFACFTNLTGMREKVGIKVVKALARNNEAVGHAALDMITTLMQPMHDDYDIRQEQLNKTSVMSSKAFLSKLLDIFTSHIIKGTGALVIAAMLDFLTFALCAPYSETTDGAHFDTLLEMVASHGRSIFRLFQHPSLAIVKGAGLVMKALIEEGDADISAKMQDLALAEGALPKHLHAAMFTQSNDSRMLTVRQLSRHLVGLWVTSHPTAIALLSRILPAGLLSYLDSEEEVPLDDIDRINVRDNLKQVEEDENQRRRRVIQWRKIEKQIETVLQHWRARIGFENKQTSQKEERPVVLRKRRQRIKSEANWKMFYYQFSLDHSKPNLIWNFKTREELRTSLEDEIRAFNQDRELTANTIVSWNHQEFEVRYPSLNEEIKINNYFLRILLEEDENEECSAIKKSNEFFNDLYHRFLLSSKTSMKCLCLQALSVVYGRCYQEIGTFNDTRYIVGMLERCTDSLERDRLLQFINKLIYNKTNAKEMIEANGVKCLIDLLTLAHLHTSRATIPMQSNVIESGDMKRESEKEWYYKENERLGPYSYDEMKQLYKDGILHAKTRCWAQGMDGWRPLYAIPQLKWGLIATGQPVLNETDMATLILNMLIRICEFYPSRDSDNAVVRPIPKIKRILSDATCLPHLVQLLLTFDPVLVEKVACLLNEIIQDNPTISRLYLSGVFYFIMMYTGSNVLPISKFLKYTHMKQALRSTDEQKTSDIMQRSVLGHILPEAMVCYLENYDSEMFSKIFLGEFDTPEAIWSNEMRRMMIEKIASHIGDFSPRLHSNTRALYQYCPIPLIIYKQLENELFCNIYYLRHLCDIAKFPDWPIKNPVKLLKDILEAWKIEVEKKPPTMSIEDAYKVLNLPIGKAQYHDESMVRKAYFKLAQQYHPDKNPEGREMFEKVNTAYEFVCSKKKITDGPDPDNLVLILRSQSILFSRYKAVLEPYKYAGYPMLIKTVRMETDDERLFSKSVPLLAASAQLCYYTVACSALNAEELRRENGLESLQDAFSRCSSVLSKSSKEDDMAVQVCGHVLQCYSVASQFEHCREKLQEISQAVRDLCRCLYYKQLTKLCSIGSDCVASFACDLWLQTHLHQSGVLWHLLLFLFNYDFTLDEGGVEKSTESNQQETSNRLAKSSLYACARLGGYLTDEELATPENPGVRKSLTALLTPHIVKQLKSVHEDSDANKILKLLNSNTENPYLIWDNSTRTELIAFLEEQQTLHIRTGESDSDFGNKFKFTAHSKELIIGDIFVRIYNLQPNFVLDNAKSFALDCLGFIGSHAQYIHSLMTLNPQERLQSIDAKRTLECEMALEALRNVLKANPGIEIQCIGHFKLLFALLRCEGCQTLQRLALEVISAVTGCQECIDDISASSVMGFLLQSIISVEDCRLLTLEILYPLSSSTKLLKEAMNKGALIYLLYLFCLATNADVRIKTANLLAKVLSDKLVGPRLRLLLAKFIPPVFLDAMRDNCETAVHMFEGVHENPELIWNDDAREKVCRIVEIMLRKHYKAQRENADFKWHLPEDYNVVYAQAANEMVIGGVFLRIFIANPGWILRKPKEFLTELCERWTELAESNSPTNNEYLETITTTLAALFQAQPNMLDVVPQLGVLPKFFKGLTSKNNSIVKHSIIVVHGLSANNVCVEAISKVNCIANIKEAMKNRPDMIGLACEMLHLLFQSVYDNLVEQALNSQSVEFLVQLLDNRLEQCENPAAAKAQVVNALKSMQNSLKFGERVTNILEKFPIWKQFANQKHDLFITDRPIAGYLTGATTAGYLTSGKSNNSPDVPPPM